ncbi:twitching motility protein PilT [Christensenellaceae bacterium]|nr:twitching motility protein PilT [Christensenellaceae bacterium]BDF60609.1 twitching motility protein PilT [Christensenellaceae bacterium]
MAVINELILQAQSRRASDIHLTVGKAPVMRIDGELTEITEYERLTPRSAEELIRPIIPADRLGTLETAGDVDFAYASNGLRLRVNVFMQRGSFAAALRLLARDIPTIEKLRLPPVLRQFASLRRGLVLVTGPTGSGKSTTLAAMIDYINETRNCHIITVEDPIEYVHTHKKSIVNQREVSEDTIGFSSALRASLREDPDIILVGEMRDLDTIAAAVTAAETGHLVFSTLHTKGAANTLNRIIDVFPASQQAQIRAQLAETLSAVITQQLVPMPLSSGGGRVAALEIMARTDAIANLVREGKIFQIDNAIQTGRQQGMQTMDMALGELVRNRLITPEEAVARCVSPQEIRRYL